MKKVLQPPVKPMPKASTGLNLPLAMAVTFSLSIAIAVILLVVTAGIALGFAWQKVMTFANAAQTSPIELAAQGITGYFTPLQTEPNGRLNFLILGVDTLANRDSSIPLTDTIMIISTNVSQGQMTAISLPRDIWDPTYKDKINSIYATGLQRNVFPPTQLMSQEVTTLTGVPIDQTVVVTLDQVAELIDLLGGVKVNVPNAFTDPLFPRPDVNVTTVHDPAKLYKTVTFDVGPQIMSGSRALEYIRSRHSLGIEGTDNARELRQQLVIQSVLQQLKTIQPTQNLALVGKLYAYYVKNFADDVSVPEAIAIGRKLYTHITTLNLSGQGLSVYPDDKNGVIFHPDQRLTNGEWEYQIRDPKAFATEVQTKLGLQ